MPTPMTRCAAALAMLMLGCSTTNGQKADSRCTVRVLSMDWRISTFVPMTMPRFMSRGDERLDDTTTADPLLCTHLLERIDGLTRDSSVQTVDNRIVCIVRSDRGIDTIGIGWPLVFEHRQRVMQFDATLVRSLLPLLSPAMRDETERVLTENGY